MWGQLILTAPVKSFSCAGTDSFIFIAKKIQNVLVASFVQKRRGCLEPRLYTKAKIAQFYDEMACKSYLMNCFGLLSLVP